MSEDLRVTKSISFVTANSEVRFTKSEDSGITMAIFPTVDFGHPVQCLTVTRRELAYIFDGMDKFLDAIEEQS